MPFADLSDVRCRFEIMGNGDPLLMIAGLGSSCEKWGSVAQQLAQSFTLILVDNRNMGQSVRPSNAAMSGGSDRRLCRIARSSSARPCPCSGIIPGRHHSQRLAIDHPSRVDRLVLISCTNRFGPYLREMAKLLEMTLRKFPFEYFRRTMEVLATSPEYFDTHCDEIEAAIRASGSSNEHRVAIARQLRCLGSDEVASADEYRIQSPTLVLAGARDMLIPSMYARQMADEIPGSEFMLLDACGHDPMQEKPEIAIPRIAEFLSRSSHAAHNRASQKSGNIELMMMN